MVVVGFSEVFWITQNDSETGDYKRRNPERPWSASWWLLWVTRSSPAQKHGRWCRPAPRPPQVVGRDAEYLSTLLLKYQGWGLPWRWKLLGCSCGSCRFQWPETDLRQRVAGLVVQSRPVRWGKDGYQRELDRTQTTSAFWQLSQDWFHSRHPWFCIYVHCLIRDVLTWSNNIICTYCSFI